MALRAGHGAVDVDVEVHRCQVRLLAQVLGMQQRGGGHAGGLQLGGSFFRILLLAPARDGGVEYWLLDGKATPKQVLQLCNDGYGSSGVGEDEVEVGPNRLVHHQYGGSSWRWSMMKRRH